MGDSKENTITKNYVETTDPKTLASTLKKCDWPTPLRLKHRRLHNIEVTQNRFSSKGKYYNRISKPFATIGGMGEI